MSRAGGASVFSRTGPLDRASMWEKDSDRSVEVYDQCIFLNYYKMKSRPLWRSTVMRAASGDHELPYDGDEDGPPEAGMSSSMEEEYGIDVQIEQVSLLVHFWLPCLVRVHRADFLKYRITILLPVC